MSLYRESLGLSAQAIAYSGRVDHPYDPADLQRCVDFCAEAGISVTGLRGRMAGRSPQWDALLPHWETLTRALADEIATRRDGRAPATYDLMRGLLDGAS